MQPATGMMKDRKAFDDYLKCISIADFDVEFVDGVADDDVDLYDDDHDVATDETARVVFAGPIKVVAPLESPTSVHSVIRPPRNPARAATSSYGRAAASSRRYRDRRRNPDQRERENAKRRIKQAYFLKRRSDCFRAEYALRLSLCNIISSAMDEYDVNAEDAITLLPAKVRAVIARAEAAMKRYRTFTGQRNIREQLNRFPTWPTDEDESD